MFEVWANEEEPPLHLVMRPGSPMPQDLAERDWSLLGLCKISPDIADEVEHRGYALVEFTTPFDADRVLSRKP